MEDWEFFSFIQNFKDWKNIKTNKHELNYFIKFENGIIYLFFQESDGKKDWKDNLNFLPTYSKVYKEQKSIMVCHRGFIGEYKSGNDQIMNELKNLIETSENAKIIISGWSNGAAMATLAAEDCFFRFSIKPFVITFGSPKVAFNKKTANYIKNCCASFKEYCNYNDIVTKVPPIGQHINKINCGQKKIFGILNPWKYHTNYDEDLKNGQ